MDGTCIVLVCLTPGTRRSTRSSPPNGPSRSGTSPRLLEDRPIGRAVDLGCGTGELTAPLAGRRGIADMTGVDSSPAMLASGAGRPAGREGDIGSWASRATTTSCSPTPACSGCPTTPPWSRAGGRRLAPGGQLAVQVPTNADHPAHRLAAEVASSEPFRSALGGPPPPIRSPLDVLAPEQYASCCTTSGRRASTCGCRCTAMCSIARRRRRVGERARRSRASRRCSRPKCRGLRRRAIPGACSQTIGDTAPYFYAFKRILFWGVKA